MSLKQFSALIVIFFGQHCFGQDTSITTIQLREIFKSSIVQKSKSKIEVDSNPWFTSNADSAFFKSDTIYLVQNNPNQNYIRKNSCAFIGWTFYKKDQFIQSDIDYCNEPPTRRAITKKDFFSLIVTEDGNKAVIKTYRGRKLVNTYLVLDYKKFTDSFANEDVSVMTLLRKK